MDVLFSEVAPPRSAFEPPVDVFANDGVVLIEIHLPDVAEEDVTIVRLHEGILVEGTRREPSGGVSFHSEIPRGPFRRAIPLPFPLEVDPPFELERGVLRIRLSKPPTSDGSSVPGNEAQENAVGPVFKASEVPDVGRDLPGMKTRPSALEPSFLEEFGPPLTGRRRPEFSGEVAVCSGGDSFLLAWKLRFHGTSTAFAVRGA
ncbi:MAG: Hsp20/alpha crystallin family protein [Myxococcales bacterium]|nr:Hsp20/alpha crystallin family protein [Myxococcales bacterium]